MSRRESVGRLTARQQSMSEPPLQQMVSVAVLPPRLNLGLGPANGAGYSDAFGWDDALNWQQDRPLPTAEERTRKPSLRQKIGLTRERKRAFPDSDLPPFKLKQVPYDVWRKHYAKDKDGNYRGTRAPAEDCLLKPDDVQKWRLGEAQTLADKWTRGKEALPVYAEVQEHGKLPEYEVDYDGPPREDPIVAGAETAVTEEEDEIADRSERRGHDEQLRRDFQASTSQVH